MVSTSPGSTEDDLRAGITTLGEKFAVTAAAAPSFTASVPADGRWVTPVDCAALAAAAPVAAVLPGWRAERGDGPGERAAGHLRSVTAAGALYCRWSPPDDAGALPPFETQLLPGGARAEAGLDAGSELVIAGVDRSVLIGARTDVVLQVFDGPNWLEVDSNSTTIPMDDVFAPVAGALVEALNADLAG